MEVKRTIPQQLGHPMRHSSGTKTGRVSHTTGSRSPHYNATMPARLVGYLMKRGGKSCDGDNEGEAMTSVVNI